MAAQSKAPHHIYTAFGLPHGTEVTLFTLVPRPPDAHYDSLGELLCWIFKDTLATRLREAIETSNYAAGPPAAERPALLESIEARLFDLELQEETLIVESEDRGQDLPRRPDARPEIILSWPGERLAA
jgi:hypothetical protein